MKCINCGAADLEQRLIDLPAEVKGERVMVLNIDGLICPNCDYKTIAGSRMAEYMRLASDVYRSGCGLLTSDEIRTRRAKLRFSQDQFASYLGVGVASVKRWELGQVQDVAMDRLIRVMSDPQEARLNYLRVAKSPRLTNT